MMIRTSLLSLLSLLALLSGSLLSSRVIAAPSWELLDDILNGGVQQKAFPGAVATVIHTRTGDTLYHRGVGSFTYGDPAPINGKNPRVDVDTLYDMASLTKVLVATTAAARLYQQGRMPLDVSLCDPALLGPIFCREWPEKAAITVSHLLEHNSGFAADPIPGYFAKSFGCPESSKHQPDEKFSCQEKIHAELANEGLRNRPGERYVYSDLSMMTLMFLIGKIAREHELIDTRQLDPECVAGWLQRSEYSGTELHTLSESLPVDQCYYDAYIRYHVTTPMFERKGENPDAMHRGFTYRVPREFWGAVAPTEHDQYYLNRVVQGQVHDGNAYASGGVQGHAGLFSTSRNATSMLELWLGASPDDDYLNSTTVKLFTAVVDGSFSSRALGWDTNHPTPSRPHGSSHCGTLSEKTFMHTGFTGTMVCADPDRQLAVVLLTNRVYPTRENTQISAIRNKFARAVQEIFDTTQQ